MLPGMEMLACPNLAVSPEVMQHIVQVESGANPYAIGVVDGHLVRQPRNMDEALATAQMLESKGYNFSLGIAQVNRSNLERYGLDSYRKAFNTCDNLAAGAQILAKCYASAHAEWGKAFSCYYSGNFTAGFRDGYVQKVYASINRDAKEKTAAPPPVNQAIPLATPAASAGTAQTSPASSALRPLVVYASDSAQYRVALRSVAIDTTAQALMPLVTSAADRSAHTEGRVPVDAMGSNPTRVTDDQASLASTSWPDGKPPTSPNSVRSRAAITSALKPADDGVFEPTVRGPNDPPTRSASITQGSRQPRADGADLRLEQTDAAFVF